jgi:ATP-dependent HslUV protease ATP-binding subunit HslU
VFTDDAVQEIAEIAFMTNEQTENIGARRLHTIMEKLLEDISFDIPDSDKDEITIDEEYVKNKFIDRIMADDIDRYIL